MHRLLLIALVVALLPGCVFIVVVDESTPLVTEANAPLCTARSLATSAASDSSFTSTLSRFHD